MPIAQLSEEHTFAYEVQNVVQGIVRRHVVNGADTSTPLYQKERCAD